MKFKKGQKVKVSMKDNHSFIGKITDVIYVVKHETVNQELYIFEKQLKKI